MKTLQRIAIIGGGPSGLFMYKRLVDSGHSEVTIDIFEKNQQLGAGMPYSTDGANDEHITNVSDNEIPELVNTISEWISSVSKDTLDKYKIDPKNFNEYKVLPRLLFGQYLGAQFALLQKAAKTAGIQTTVHYGTTIVDITDDANKATVTLQSENGEKFEFDTVIVCSGHRWPKKHEGKVKGYFDSPYPPAKLKFKANHPVALRGSSLTAIDAIRTMARENGSFSVNDNGDLTYQLAADSPNFKMVMHSRNGLLPAVRFHLEDSHLSKDSVLSEEVIACNRAENDGFLSLDFVFERNFKDSFKEKRPEFYERIKDMSIEDFVTAVMKVREGTEPFKLIEAEYEEAEISIEKHQSVYWKEMLAVLSFDMNYPAKYFSAEDTLRLHKTLMPLISVVIAFAPQPSVDDMMALHKAGVLDIITVGDDSNTKAVETGGAIYDYTDEKGNKYSQHYETFVDCVGQPHLSYDDLPYPGLLANNTVSPAKIKFRDAAEGLNALKSGKNKVSTDGQGNYYLSVPGITINDDFQVVDKYGAFNDRVYMMSVPYIGGYNPDYSGLDFCEAASERVSKRILQS
ncbi:hypothetical protein FPZ43_03115 [Mucilaginibacter pallidiroseus]|uniref:FAD-dependent urate hydroxylase HpyO/Asp monooxygenase CreE-like FAD/NAD(P)-binding domain-containing protein n=1 Tax=Mucilaginibacter pallidiroseus TaxID=2599295 RepID=A0A563UJB6_9SPHI|nr:FAD/NAD(P)-binding protein [Mucilaginibacter pallidiroseus]TWR31480.1 hypothetical protein FPZ43_03115 [Mucilaginibacter pallidiroseus]